jgi:hypothetical protein
MARSLSGNKAKNGSTRQFFRDTKGLAKKGQRGYSSNMTSEELNLLRQENQALRERADLLEKTTRMLEETISLPREQIGLKDQLIAASQRETMLLTQQVQQMQAQLEKDS